MPLTGSSKAFNPIAENIPASSLGQISNIIYFAMEVLRKCLSSLTSTVAQIVVRILAFIEPFVQEYRYFIHVLSFNIDNGLGSHNVFRRN